MIKFLPALAFLLLALSAHAQYDGPALEACRSYAKREAKREGSEPKDIVLVRDQALFMERYGRKLGSQPVASILTGNGAVVFDNAPSAELSFICLLADEKRPVFFNWLPRHNVSVLAQCTRAEELAKELRPCLELLLRVAENDLTQIYAQRFQEAHQRGESALAAYRKSNDEWKEYRVAECARRRHFAPEGLSAEDFELACMAEITRRRHLDVR